MQGDGVWTLQDRSVMRRVEPGFHFRGILMMCPSPELWTLTTTHFYKETTLGDVKSRMNSGVVKDWIGLTKSSHSKLKRVESLNLLSLIFG